MKQSSRVIEAKVSRGFVHDAETAPWEAAAT
jgi:hypothetical protein